MIRLFLIVQVTHPSHQRGVTLFLGPLDCFALRSGSVKDMIRVVFDNIIVDMAPLWASFGSCFYINIRHALLQS